jgi:hypothetical protein
MGGRCRGAGTSRGENGCDPIADVGGHLKTPNRTSGSGRKTVVDFLESVFAASADAANQAEGTGRPGALTQPLSEYPWVSAIQIASSSVTPASRRTRDSWVLERTPILA